MLKDISRKEQRYDAVTMVMRDGFSITDIAAKFNVSRQTVYHGLAKYEEGTRGTRRWVVPAFGAVHFADDLFGATILAQVTPLWGLQWVVAARTAAPRQSQCLIRIVRRIRSISHECTRRPALTW